LRIGESVLRNFGNVSSASVLLVLERWLAEGGYRKPGYGLIVSFGPGFAAEMVLVRT
jgi:alkylresorcinol/alkylpyrone synthase